MHLHFPDVFSYAYFDVEKPPELLIYPSESQIVAIGDRFHIKCEVVSKQKRTLKWTKNHTFPPPEHLKILKEQIGFNEILYVEFVSITMEDLGLYTCVGEGLVPKAITVQVVTSKKKMCSRDVTNSKERMLWPVTVQRSTASLRCPWPNNKKNYTSVRLLLYRK